MFTSGQGFTQPVTAEQLADLFNVSRTMIYKYRDQGMPQQARNVFDLRECVRWMIERAAKPQTATEETTRAALNNAQRERVEIEIARSRGELIPRSDVRTTLIEVAQIVVSQLDALAPRLAPLSPTWSSPAECQAAILAEALAIRAAIAHRLRDFATAAELAPASPTAPAKRTRVKASPAP